MQYFWDDGKCLTANFGRICTGQDKCYNNNANSEQSCSNVGQSFSGQDAQYAQKGVCIPKDFAQKTLGNNQTVVVDRNLNIMWQLAIDSSNKRTWDDANSYCEDLKYDGLSGWRLPTVKELLSIVDNSKDSNAAYEIFGSLPASPLFWSSKTYGDNGINVSLKTGESSRVAKSTTLYVRCVKGTKEGDGNFVQANVGGDTIVTDKTTGLIWYNNDTTVSWQDALSACEDLEYAGFDDWRLPNKNELASLYNFEASTGNSDYPGMSTTKKSWSSTTIKKYNNMAWVVDFKTGGNGALKIDQQFSKGTTTDISYMCVRTATCGAGKNWDGEKCVDPCEGSGCGELDNSTGVCRLETLDTTKCECEDEYFWTKDEPNDNYICGAEERTVDCIGLPEHASWNTATQITQTLTDVITYKLDMWGNQTDEIDHIDYKYDPTAQGSYNTTASENECRFKCESGYYWNNSSQCLNPCNPNPCSSLSNSTGACTASNATTYKCGCNSGYFWDTSRLSCRKPCDNNPCLNVNNSTGGCSNANATSLNGYTCECNIGYFWNGSSCQKSINLGKICTGQNQCYNNGNNSITCPEVGENFFGQDYQYTQKCSTKTFSIKTTTISGQNIVLDKKTGLEWQQTIPSTGYTWSQANTYCNNLSYGNYSDWRLPTPKELFTIINDSTYAPATYTDYFTNTASDANYWTSKKVAGNTSLAWTVSIRWGYTSSQSASSSQTAEGSEPIKVRCVRAAILREGNFSTSTENNQDIVTDNTTGLMWTKNYVTDKTWQEALKYCEDLTYANSSFWRLPNKNELISLVNYDKREPSTDFPGMTESRSFWTSTSRPNLPERAFDVYFLNGNIATQPKTGEKRAVICVK